MFDDAIRSHVEVASPLLKWHGFDATSFVTEGFDVPTNKRDYMIREERAHLDRDGFEIGNHTRDHQTPGVRDARGRPHNFCVSYPLLSLGLHFAVREPRGLAFFAILGMVQIGAWHDLIRPLARRPGSCGPRVGVAHCPAFGQG